MACWCSQSCVHAELSCCLSGGLSTSALLMKQTGVTAITSTASDADAVTITVPASVSSVAALKVTVRLVCLYVSVCSVCLT
jgi:hypothetical protein